MKNTRLTVLSSLISATISAAFLTTSALAATGQITSASTLTAAPVTSSVTSSAKAPTTPPNNATSAPTVKAATTAPSKASQGSVTKAKESMGTTEANKQVQAKLPPKVSSKLNEAPSKAKHAKTTSHSTVKHATVNTPIIASKVRAS